jgi:Xaa-Pro aminopeptidase
MTITNEPGIYLAGRFGVRIENTMIVVPADTSKFFSVGDEAERGSYLQLEPLTLCPIDTTPIVPGMLTDDEREWLNDYHTLVYERLAPLLSSEERAWLREKTSEL